MEKTTIFQLHSKLSIMAHHVKAITIANRKDKEYDVIVHGTEGFEKIVMTTQNLFEAEKEKNRMEKIIYEFVTHGGRHFSSYT